MLGDSKVAKAFKAAGAPGPRPAIRVDDIGFGLALDPAQSDTITPAFSWPEITSVTVFKRDLFAVDLICLRFEGPHDQAWEVNEEMAGWTELVDSLPVHLRGCMTKHEVLEHVVLPAFARNELVIYRRSSA